MIIVDYSVILYTEKNKLTSSADAISWDSVRSNMRRKDSLNTVCPKESPITVTPPVLIESSFISSKPIWSREQVKMSMTWEFFAQRSI